MAPKTQKSKKIRDSWLQFDTLCCGTGWDENDLKIPQILIEDVFGSSHPGSYHLDALSQEASTGVYQEGGKPAQFHGTDICDGWAMSHEGMNFILASREVLCDLVEVHGRVIPWERHQAFLYSHQRSICKRHQSARRAIRFDQCNAAFAGCCP
jgi:dihydroxy-acid dehydratase